MKEVFICDCCHRIFNTIEECVEHEKVISELKKKKYCLEVFSAHQYSDEESGDLFLHKRVEILRYDYANAIIRDIAGKTAKEIVDNFYYEQDFFYHRIDNKNSFLDRYDYNDIIRNISYFTSEEDEDRIFELRVDIKNDSNVEYSINGQMYIIIYEIINVDKEEIKSQNFNYIITKGNSCASKLNKEI